MDTGPREIEMLALILASFLLIHSSKSQSMECYCPCLGAGLPTSVNSIQQFTPLHKHPEVCLQCESRSCQVDQHCSPPQTTLTASQFCLLSTVSPAQVLSSLSRESSDICLAVIKKYCGWDSFDDSHYG